MSESSRLKMSIGIHFLILLTGILPALGCGGSSEPSSPELSAGQTAPGASGGRSLWGVWHVSLDPSSMTADITPLRGVEFTCNVTQFMQPPSSPVQMVQISVDPSSNPGTGYFAVDVILKHPFPGLNQFRGFDVRGIMMTDGSIAGLHDASILRAGPDDTQLLNPDGYARWWNSPEFTSYNTIFGFTQGKLAPPTHPTCTVNPYKLFGDELEPLDPLSALNPDSRVTFATTPGVNRRRYEIQFKMSGPKPLFDFNYAVDASWSAPDQAYKPDYPEEAFNLSANCNEAFMVIIADAGSSAYFENESSKGGAFKLDIEVFDHQAVLSPNGMADEVAAIWVEGDVMTEPVDVLPSATILPGSGTQSSVYEVAIGNLDLHESGETQLFLAVESKNVTTYEPQVPGGDAFDFPDAPLAAFLTYGPEIADHNLFPAPVVTDVVPDTGNPDTVVYDLEVHGLNFVDGAVVEFKHADSSFVIGPISATFVDSTLLTLDLDLTGAETGLYDVTVTNPDTQFGTLEDGFEVIVLKWWQSHMFNVENIGWNPTADMPDPSSLQQEWMANIGGFKFTTPVVADDKIFFTTNSTYWERSDMSIYCYDLNSPTQLWTKYINPTSASTGWRSFSCPVWWHGPDGIDRIAVGGDQVYCFNADTGAQLWTYDTTEGGTNIGWWSNQMQEYEGKVIAHSRFQYLYILDFTDGSLIKKITTSAAAEGGCAVVDDKIYINSSYYIDCADLNTGSILWSTLLPASAGNMDHWINPVIIGNRLYVTSYNGYVFCVCIASEGGFSPGDIIWSWNDTTKPAGMTGMIAGAGARQSGGVTRLYVSSSSGSSMANVYCLEDQGTSASLVWSSAHTGSYEGDAIWANAPSYSEGVVYAPDVYNGTLYAFDASNGSTIWTYYIGAVTSKCGVSIVDDRLILLNNQNLRVLMP
jgi:outer membrane protein assembly factor BamB